jgi:hypothetical protein
MSDLISPAAASTGDRATGSLDRPVRGDFLPIGEIALQALLTLLKYPLDLIKHGALPFLLSVALGVGGCILRPTGVMPSVGFFWIAFALTLIYVPFDVAWTRLVFSGPTALAGRRWLSFGFAEVNYTFAEILLGCAWLLIIPPLLLARLGLKYFDSNLALEGLLVGLWTIVAIAVCVVRSMLVLPAIALGRYPGLAEAWRLTRGNFERLGILQTVLRGPSLLVIAYLDQIVAPYAPLALKASFIVLECALFWISEAAVVAMLALVYRIRTAAASAAALR